MGYKIVWTKQAVELYIEIMGYLSNNFSEKEVNSFYEKVQKKLALIALYPRMHRVSPRLRNTYRTVISRQVVLIYRYQPRKKEIQLLQFWQTRRSPGGLKF